jgi:hypothetical protein
VSPFGTTHLNITVWRFELKIQDVFDADHQQKNHSKAGRRAAVLPLWTFWLGLSTLAFGDSLFAVYAPGCVTVPELHTSLYGENVVKFFEGRLALVNARKTSEKQDAIVAAYRVACTDSNRSVIWLSFSIPPELDSSTLYLMPNVSYVLKNANEVSANLSRDPRGSLAFFGPPSPVIGNSDENAAAEDSPRTWLYIVHGDGGWGWDLPLMTPELYNESFSLLLGTPAFKQGRYRIEVPSTATVLKPNTHLPLNGRLSGHWVVEGAADQGIMLAISELVPGSIPAPDEIGRSKLLLFLSWYTFDDDGKPLWLTGSAQFLPGESEVTLPIVLVSQGEFLGAAGGQRTQAGSVNLRSVSCGQIDVGYDLSGIGLGSGSTKLKRLFSLEISDYPCSDKTDQQGVES